MLSKDNTYLPNNKKEQFEKHFKGLKDKNKGYFEHRFSLDSYYVKNESLFFDLGILFDTFFLVLKKMFSKK